MEPEEPIRPAEPTKAEPTPVPTDAELSRIAREAVRQPADPRLDRQLERMGLTGAPAQASPAAVPPVANQTVDALQARVRRLESTVLALVLAVGIIGVAVVVLLLR